MMNDSKPNEGLSTSLRYVCAIVTQPV